MVVSFAEIKDEKNVLHVKQRCCLVPQNGEGGGVNVVQTLALDVVETVSLKLSVIQ